MIPERKFRLMIGQLKTDPYLWDLGDAECVLFRDDYLQLSYIEVGESYVDFDGDLWERVE